MMLFCKDLILARTQDSLPEVESPLTSVYASVHLKLFEGMVPCPLWNPQAVLYAQGVLKFRGVSN